MACGSAPHTKVMINNDCAQGNEDAAPPEYTLNGDEVIDFNVIFAAPYGSCRVVSKVGEQDESKDVAFHGIYLHPQETKERGYSFYRLDTGVIQTRTAFQAYDEYPEEVLMKLHSKRMREMK